MLRPTIFAQGASSPSFLAVLVKHQLGRQMDNFGVNNQLRGAEPLPPRCGDSGFGRIFLQPQSPEGRPWFWTITAPDIPPSLDKRGYSATREEAMAAFKAR